MREGGFYWVKTASGWEVAEWSIHSKKWWFCGDETGYKDETLVEIGEMLVHAR